MKEERRGCFRRRYRTSLTLVCLASLLGTLAVGCTPSSETKARESNGALAESKGDVTMARSGYADVNGIRLYHEIYGSGEPLVLIPGGLTTIGEMHDWVQALAKTRQVIAVEMQGHGHTADTDRPMTWTRMGDDIAALLDSLKISNADLMGHSFGGASVIRAAIQHPEKVRRLVVISSPHMRSAWFPETQKGMASVSAGMAEQVMQTPTGALSKQWPEPQRFAGFLDKFGKMMGENYDWSDDIARLPMPVLLVFADNDAIPPKHIADFFALLGGGVKETGWQDPKLSTSRLAIVPGYSHYNFKSAPEVPPIIDKFLRDSLSNAGPPTQPSSKAPDSQRR